MSELRKYRELIEKARGLGAMPVDSGDMQMAIDRVRGRLRKPGSRYLGNWFAQRWVWVSGSIAAAIVVGVVIAIVIATLPKPVDAAEALRASSRATSNYRGWVHVTYDISQFATGVLKLVAGDAAHIHINNTNGDLAVEFKVFGSECIELVAADTGKEMEYIGLRGELQVSSLSKSQTAAMRQAMVAFPLNPEEVIAESKTRGWPDPKVTKSVDQGLERFDVVFPGNPTTRPSSQGDSSTNSMTIWSDPESKLIRRMVMVQDGKQIAASFSYGDPQIRDIYDLGVPRSAKVVEINSPANDAALTVMQFPDIKRLVKDDSLSVNELEGRLRKYAEASLGDYICIDCQEQVISDRISDRHGMIMVMASQGDMGFNDRFEVGATLGFFGGASYPKGWPTPNVADLLSAAKQAFHDSIVVYNGNHIWGNVSSYSNDKSGKIHEGPATQFSSQTAKAMRISALDLSGQIWPHIDKDVPFGGMAKPSVEILRDPSRPELIVLHVKRKEAIFSGASTRPEFTSEDYFWLDPKRDDLPVESLDFLSNFGSGSTSHTVYLAFAQLADGRWYPKHCEVRSVFPPKGGLPEPGYLDQWRQIFQDQKLDNEWFTDPDKRLKGIQSMFPTTEPVAK